MSRTNRWQRVLPSEHFLSSSSFVFFFFFHLIHLPSKKPQQVPCDFAQQWISLVRYSTRSFRVIFGPNFNRRLSLAISLAVMPNSPYVGTCRVKRLSVLRARARNADNGLTLHVPT